MEFVEWLTEEMNSRGWGVTQLAKEAGLSHSTVSQVLNRKNGASFEFCNAIAPALGYTAEEVFRYAGLLPTHHGDKEVQELNGIAKSLPHEELDNVLEYARWRFSLKNLGGIKAFNG